MGDEQTGKSADRTRLEQALPRLAAALADKMPSAGEGIAIDQQFEAGQSNPTYLLRLGGSRYVLRKQPYGNLLPKAHDVLREHALMKALYEQGFPVPKPFISVTDKDVVGAACFLMEFVPGIVESDPALLSRPQPERRKIYNAMAETLADLHRIDPAVLDTVNIRYRPDFVGRQVKIWSSQYVASQTEPDDRVDHIAAWLLDNRPPESRTSIVHGDFRIENLILQGAAVGAVLDWELCTIGEPLCDLSYCCIWYHLPRSALSGLAEFALPANGIPEEAEFVDRYSSRSGIDGARSHNYFMAFSFYRLAAIMQGVYKRGLDGNASSPMALSRGALARLCLDRAESFASR